MADSSTPVPASVVPSDSAPDTRAAPATDFTVATENVDLTSNTTTAYYNIKMVKVIRLTGESVPGARLALFQLDDTLEPILGQMMKAYERWSLSDLQVIAQTGSPLGTSSGSIQLAHFPDPENANLPEDGGQAALDKVVRQDGSVQIRPRDSCTFKLHTPGTNYTLKAGSSRWNSFGAIGAVCRSVPDATDYTEWNLTVTGTAVLTRTAVISSADNVMYDALVKEASIEDNAMTLKVASIIPASSGDLHFAKPMKISTTSRIGGLEMKKARAFTRMPVIINDHTITADLGGNGIISNSLVTNLVGRVITLRIPRLDYTPIFN